ncbi:MAG: hypothetical protein ACRBF0_00585 [Calditrichia bacterium]
MKIADSPNVRYLTPGFSLSFYRYLQAATAGAAMMVHALLDSLRSRGIRKNDN